MSARAFELMRMTVVEFARQASALRSGDIRARLEGVKIEGVKNNAPARLGTAGGDSPLGESEMIYVGRMMRSARSRNCRAISIGSPVSTSVAASRSTSCCADRISASTISIANSLAA